MILRRATFSPGSFFFRPPLQMSAYNPWMVRYSAMPSAPFYPSPPWAWPFSPWPYLRSGGVAPSPQGGVSALARSRVRPDAGSAAPARTERRGARGRRLRDAEYPGVSFGLQPVTWTRSDDSASV